MSDTSRVPGIAPPLDGECEHEWVYLRTHEPPVKRYAFDQFYCRRCLAKQRVPWGDEHG